MSTTWAVQETVWGGLLMWRKGRQRNALTDGGRWRVLDFGLLTKTLWAFHQTQRSELGTLGWLPKECRDAREDADSHLISPCLSVPRASMPSPGSPGRKSTVKARPPATAPPLPCCLYFERWERAEQAPSPLLAIHSFSKHLFTECYMPRTELDDDTV